MNRTSATERLRAALGERASTGVPLAEHTTMRVGGPADLLLVARSRQELAQAAQAAQAHRVPWRVLGGGANVLVADAGITGLVIVNKASQVDVRADGEVYAESGASLIGLARACVERGLTGLEWATGVPGTVGGAVIGNAGAYRGETADNLQSGTVLELRADQARVVERPVDWFEYGYRHSRLKQAVRERRSAADETRYVLLAATFALAPGDPDEIQRKVETLTALRTKIQPPGASTGSTFKNPPDDKAGRLIEAAGLKGRRVGGAVISPLHANFIVNQGGARASDIKALIDLVQEQVRQQFGVRLELEIQLIGNW